MQHTAPPREIPAAAGLSRDLADHLTRFVGSLLVRLDRQLDRRLVQTFGNVLVGILKRRERTLNLLLTDIGEVLTDGAHAPAGVKRIARLIHSPKWAADLVDTWLLEEADQAVATAIERDGVAFLVEDGSEIEKPTARKLEGLTKVRSAVAALLQRASGGPPPTRPTVVPGFGWTAAVVTGLTGSLTLARLHWYSPTAPGGAAERQRQAETGILRPLVERWRERVVVLLDQGFAGSPIPTLLRELNGRFILRWRRDYHLVDVRTGEDLAASALTRRVRSQYHTTVYDPRRKERLALGVAAVPVRLPGGSEPFWLVVARRKRGGTLWFLTTEDASSEAGALFVVQGYSRRWQVEWAFRFGKSDLGMASIRVRKWAARLKLWAIAAVAHAFLLWLLCLDDGGWCRAVLRWCHRTGARAASPTAPLYRLHHGLTNLWNAHWPSLARSLKFGV